MKLITKFRKEFFRLALMLIIFHPVVVVAEEGPLCALKKEFLIDRYQNRISVNDLIDKVRAENPSVVLIGEDHDQRIRQYYSTLLSKLKNITQADCLAVETHSVQAKLDVFNARDRIDFTSNEFRRLIDEAPGFETVIEAGFRAGLKVFAVDKPNLLLQTGPHSVESKHSSPSERDLEMFSQTQSLLENTCRRVILTVGSIHMSNRNRRSLPVLFAEKGISFFSLLLVDSGPAFYTAGNRDYASYWNWILPILFKGTELVCAETPGTVYENFAFMTKGSSFAPELPISCREASEVNIEGVDGRWSEIDAALVIGCPTDDVESCRPMEPHPLDLKGYLSN